MSVALTVVPEPSHARSAAAPPDGAGARRAPAPPAPAAAARPGPLGAGRRAGAERLPGGGGRGTPAVGALLLPCQKLGPISGPARQCNGARSTMAGWEERFGDYVGRLGDVPGRADRRAPLRAYTTGLLLPGERKSVEPMAARVDPARVGAAHQSLHHFVAKAAWGDAALLAAVRAYALPALQERGPIRAWLVDDTGLPKKGEHSAGVARQYRGTVGKRENSDVRRQHLRT